MQNKGLFKYKKLLILSCEKMGEKAAAAETEERSREEVNSIKAGAGMVIGALENYKKRKEEALKKSRRV